MLEIFVKVVKTIYYLLRKFQPDIFFDGLGCTLINWKQENTAPRHVKFENLPPGRFCYSFFEIGGAIREVFTDVS
jgi:hypothetical protein